MTNKLDLFFGNLEVKNNELLSYEEAQKEIFLDWNYKRNKLYMLILYDLNTEKIHLFQVNIEENNYFETGDIYVEYEPPHPELDTHKYIIVVKEQKRKIEDQNIPDDFLRFFTALPLPIVGSRLFKVEHEIRRRMSLRRVRFDEPVEESVEESVEETTRRTF
jgi:hypothetical protein